MKEAKGASKRSFDDGCKAGERVEPMFRANVAAVDLFLSVSGNIREPAAQANLGFLQQNAV